MDLQHHEEGPSCTALGRAVTSTEPGGGGEMGEEMQVCLRSHGGVQSKKPQDGKDHKEVCTSLEGKQTTKRRTKPENKGN